MNICAKNISKSFLTPDEAKPLFENITITFTQGKSYAIMGPSGSGKSTLLHILAGLESPSSGTIDYTFNNNGTQTITMLTQLHRLQQLSIIFQRPYLIAELTVIENCMLKGIINAISYKVAQQRALELLQLVGLETKAMSMIHTLSGGQQQRLSIAQALFFSPSIIIADEPTAHVDEHQAAEIMHILIAYTKKNNACCIIATHHQAVASHCDALYILEHKTLHKGNLHE
jgi:ABC-type lipoprotein export system ATPase subunit